MKDPFSLQQQIEHLNRIGISLTLEHDLQTLLELIVREARTLCRADGGSLYLVHNNKLQFLVAQNEALSQRLGGEDVMRKSFVSHEIDITPSSLAGFVATSAQTLNIEDVYALPPDVEYSFSPAFDERNNYRSKSMLLVPMKDREDQVAGVLCLLNAMDEHRQVISFNRQYETLLLSIASQAMAAVENARLIEKLKTSYLDTIFCLSMAAEQRDNETGAHVRRISEYSAILAKALGFSPEETETIRYASPLHDVGKIGIPDRILQKPGKLTDQEYDVMKTHTLIGAKILKGDSEYMDAARIIALNHHEKLNGSGYPQGLRGDDIHIYGRIVAVADVFDALVSERVYKKAMPPEEARELIQDGSNEHFSPAVVNAFEKTYDDFLEARQRFSDEDEAGERLF